VWLKSNGGLVKRALFEGAIVIGLLSVLAVDNQLKGTALERVSESAQSLPSIVE
jgi:hypothetical protein